MFDFTISGKERAKLKNEIHFFVSMVVQMLIKNKIKSRRRNPAQRCHLISIKATLVHNM